MIRTLLPLLYRAAEAFQIDVALCAPSQQACCVATMMRERCCPYASGPWWMITPEQQRHISRISEDAKSGKLALLFGDGISASSGLVRPAGSGIRGRDLCRSAIWAQSAGSGPSQRDLGPVSGIWVHVSGIWAHAILHRVVSRHSTAHPLLLRSLCRDPSVEIPLLRSLC